jgi:hypothetical protein
LELDQSKVTLDNLPRATRSLGTDAVKEPDPKKLHRIYSMSVASVYPHYVAKAEEKGRTKAEVDEIIRWLTGYSAKALQTQLEKKTNFETFFAKAPKLNPLRTLITGVICGVRVEDIKEPTMQEIRYLGKLVDELAKGRAMGKILRK